MKEHQENLRVAVWAAVSTKPQATEDKDSLPSQIRDGRTWAESNNGGVVATYKITGHSRSYIFLEQAADEMDAYRQLLTDCQSQKFDVLWCRGRDRLGRTDALIAQVEAVVREIGAAQIYSATLGLPLDSSHTAALYASGIERAQAQEEIERLKRRHARGMRNRVKNRKLPAGKLPYGYRRTRDKNGDTVGAEFDEFKIDAVRMVGERFLAGEGYQKLANRLNEGPWDPPESDIWDHTTVVKWLKNSTYAGYVSYNDIEVKSDKIPALWDEETWERIQNEIKSRYRGRRTPATPITSNIVCGGCGHNMVANMSHGDRVYVCGRHRRRGDCHCNLTHYTEIKAALLDFLRQLDNPEAILSAIHENQPNTDRIARELQNTRQKIEDLHDQRKRLALDRAQGNMDIDIYRAADDELLDRLTRAEDHAQTLQSQLDAAPDLEQQIASVKSITQLTKEEPEWLDAIPVQEGQTLLRRAGIKIRCRDNSVVSVSLE
jgi:DNA invertase Pin-like site-specific DNA recombinase